jgi:hypothetical protein
VLIIKTYGDYMNVGEMVCQWEEDAALATIRGFLEVGCRVFLSRVKPKGASGWPDETKIQEALDRCSVKALAMIEDYAAEAASVVAAIALNLPHLALLDLCGALLLDQSPSLIRRQLCVKRRLLV